MYQSFTSSPLEDKLDRRRIAKSLAEFLMNLPKKEGVAIGLDGPWGVGKTTLLKFVADELEKLPHLLRPTVVWINPWQMCKGADSPGAVFFETVTSKLVTEGNKLSAKQLSKLGKSV